ncbi:GOLPH3/VPS74 family protein [Falsiroseomonas selenitidurans]|uniref:GPP34 family phosphoprotein n=1 Tax=Falsiroseomonas selenitidurans TaxID=2716335 RepID=A0ABX1E1S1_9PROT|nr:GPP34 family phosphoprotein [Falsiroseomonas selenitidurans]NKC30645.1 GPP34 family phosphoprotein [Falsiroseomonas selenitidurans]
MDGPAPGFHGRLPAKTGAAMSLTMPEEILLLLLDDETGKPVGLPGPAGDLALAGAILMELALAGRIDTDLDHLVVVQQRPTGDGLLDGVLARLAASPAPRTSRAWIQDLAKTGPQMRAAVLERLVAGGVLRRIEDRFLWVFPERRYPKATGRAETAEVRRRLRAVLLEDEIPDPRDALLIGLARATGLVPLVLDEAEAAQAAPRVEQVAGLEELSRSLSAATRDVYATLLRQGAVH